jgi:hypothetical protein
VMNRSLRFLLGLPVLSDGPLWQAARALDAPILISANALSLWRRDRLGLRQWTGFDRRNLHLVWQHPVHLESGGFVSAALYRGYSWTVMHYMGLCEAAPWQWFAGADMCVEPEVAQNRTEVFDRISGTARLNQDCLIEARQRGISDRFTPIVQGWHPHDYLRCLDGATVERPTDDGRPLGRGCRIAILSRPTEAVGFRSGHQRATAPHRCAAACEGRPVVNSQRPESPACAASQDARDPAR